MERFIDFLVISSCSALMKFKIQYGEIYRVLDKSAPPIPYLFKIQYGEIYSKFRIFQTHRKRKFKIQYGEIYSFGEYDSNDLDRHLKSSMERFIASLLH